MCQCVLIIKFLWGAPVSRVRPITAQNPVVSGSETPQTQTSCFGVQEKSSSVGGLLIVVVYTGPPSGKGACLWLRGSHYLGSGLLKFLLKNMAGHGQGFCLLCSRTQWKWHSRIWEGGRWQGLAEAGTRGHSLAPASAWSRATPDSAL